MKLPNIKRIRKEDFDKKYDDLLTGLLYSINTFFESVSAGLNHNLTFTDNVAGQVKELTFTAPLSTSNTLDFKKEFTGPCKGIIIAELVPTSHPSEVLASAPFLQFNNTETGISIYNITGLVTDHKYRVRLICLAGP